MIDNDPRNIVTEAEEITSDHLKELLELLKTSEYQDLTKNLNIPISRMIELGVQMSGIIKASNLMLEAVKNDDSALATIALESVNSTIESLANGAENVDGISFTLKMAMVECATCIKLDMPFKKLIAEEIGLIRTNKAH